MARKTSNLRFKVDVTHVLSNFTKLATIYDMATANSLQEATEYVHKRMIDIYQQETRHGEHPLTIAKRNAGLDRVDIPSLIQAKPDEEGEMRIGFFDEDVETMRIVYLQEYGGSILISEKMRAWYNAMAFISKGWRPDHATIGPEMFPEEFQPLKASTRRVVIPPKFFLRRAFHELGNAAILDNRLAFALESFFRSGRIPEDTVIGGFEAARRNLDDIAGFSGNV